VEVTAELGTPRVEFDKNRFETAFKQMPTPSVPPVKPHRVADSEPLHASAQSALCLHPEQKVIMIRERARINT